jgi:hypothetical protein
MRLLKSSKDLILFFTQNNKINIKHCKKTTLLIYQLYDNINEAYKYLHTIKQKGEYFKRTIKAITTESQILKPSYFNTKSFPEKIINHINTHSKSEIIYTFSLYEREIKIIFVIEDSIKNIIIEMFNKYVDSIILWIYIINKYASKQCSTTLIIYLYFTSLKKLLPKSNIDIIDENHANTAFTTSCPKDSEIVIFRKEEWFKVLIHETFHSFGLDFSNMNIDENTKNILSIFKVNSKVTLYESYTEFWAEILNILFCSYFVIKNKNDFNEFMSQFLFLLNLERIYSLFQLVKILKFMGLTYNDLYSTNENSKRLRDQLYKENTHVLAYYIIKGILINNYQDFLLWCSNNNDSLLQFKHTLSTQYELYKFIESKYKNMKMIKDISVAEKFLINVNKQKQTKLLNYILSNLRMCICELG